MKRVLTSAVAAFSCAAMPVIAMADSDAVNVCIDQLRTVGGPDAQGGGEVLSSEFSQAGTLVMLRDAGGTVWRCIAYSDGTVGELSVTNAADDGAGAMAGGETITQRVQFQGGTTGAELTGTLSAGSSIRYQLGAKDGQFLYVRVVPNGADLLYRIYNPDGSALLDSMTPDREYRGQLWQSGDHIVEVTNRAGSPGGYTIIMGIE